MTCAFLNELRNGYIIPNLWYRYKFGSLVLATKLEKHRLAGNFRGRKLSRIARPAARGYEPCSLVLPPKDATPPISRIATKPNISASNVSRYSQMSIKRPTSEEQTFQLSLFDRETPSMRHLPPFPQFYIQLSRQLIPTLAPIA